MIAASVHIKVLDVCICAYNRPEILNRCLASLAVGDRLPATIWVSDDSSDPKITAEIRCVCDAYAVVRYLVGPKRGLCANRNAVVAASSADYVSLLDDDAVVSADFISRASDSIQTLDGRTVITGDVLENGSRRQSPTNPTFLGHFGKTVHPGERLGNINLNCNVFPRQAFEVASFDESIDYGYEDTDLCAQLLAAGLAIVHTPEFVNQHYPPKRAAEHESRMIRQAERARFATALRRYGRWQPNMARLAAFALIAPVHYAVAAVRRGRPTEALTSYGWLAHDLWRLKRATRRVPAAIALRGLEIV